MDDNNNVKINNSGVLYKLFVIVSIIICIFILPFVFNMTSKYPSAYPGSEAESGVITFDIANSIAIKVLPILIIYIALFVILVLRKANHRKVYYPLSCFTFIALLFAFGIIYTGYLFLMFSIFVFAPLVVTIVTLAKVGDLIDNDKKVSRVTVAITLGLTLLIAAALILVTVLSFPSETKNYSYEDNDSEQEQIKHEATENNQIWIENDSLKEIFNNSIKSNYISINSLKMTHDNNTIFSIEFLIETDGIPKNKMDFCNDLINSYNNIKDLLNEYNYSDQRISFTFTDKNPFADANSTSYLKDGYIRMLDNFYYIYLNPTPIEIDK